MKDFRSRTLHAISWSFGSKVTSQAISIGFGIALARLLTPIDFGLIAMVLVVMGFAGLLSDVGLGSALIQKKDVNEDHYSSAFWLNALTGLLLTLVVFMLSPYIADFYKQPELTLIARILSFNFIIDSFAILPRTRLRKILAFRELAIIDMLSMIFSGAIAIIMAASGYGYWSLVFQQLASKIISTILVWFIGRWLPKIKLSISAIKELFGFSIHVFFTQSIRYIAVQTDSLLIGKFLDAGSLGLYDKAYSMMLFPLKNISHVIGSVMFPSLSQIQDDIPRVRDVYLRITAAISLLTFPMMAGMYVVSDSFVAGVLGPNWLKITPLFKIFCAVGYFTSIATVTGPVYLSQGKAKLQLKVNLVTQPTQILGAIIGLHWGVSGVATGFAITTIFGVFVTWMIAGGLIGLKLWQIINNLLPTFILSLIMGLGVWLFSSIFKADSALANFIFQTAIGIILYLALLLLTKPPAFKDVYKIIFQKTS